METKLLSDLGGFQTLKGELIDDCALARKVKALGCKTWIGLTHSVNSRRAYDYLSEIWNMVARTAFTQLGYSGILLLLCTTVLVVTFIMPVVGLLRGPPAVNFIAATACVCMVISYMPILDFYGLSKLWALTLPFIAVLYLSMTWTSAVRYWQGNRSFWKGRSYTRT